MRATCIVHERDPEDCCCCCCIIIVCNGCTETCNKGIEEEESSTRTVDEDGIDVEDEDGDVSIVNG